MHGTSARRWSALSGLAAGILAIGLGARLMKAGHTARAGATDAGESGTDDDSTAAAHAASGSSSREADAAGYIRRLRRDFLVDAAGGLLVALLIVVGATLVEQDVGQPGTLSFSWSFDAQRRLAPTSMDAVLLCLALAGLTVGVVMVLVRSRGRDEPLREQVQLAMVSLLGRVLCAMTAALSIWIMLPDRTEAWWLHMFLVAVFLGLYACIDLDPSTARDLSRKRAELEEFSARLPTRPSARGYWGRHAALLALSALPAVALTGWYTGSAGRGAAAGLVALTFPALLFALQASGLPAILVTRSLPPTMREGYVALLVMSAIQRLLLVAVWLATQLVVLAETPLEFWTPYAIMACIPMIVGVLPDVSLRRSRTARARGVLHRAVENQIRCVRRQIHRLEESLAFELSCG